MSIPARVAKEVTNAAWVATVTIPNPLAPSERVNSTCAANVASAAITMPTTFCEVPERIVR
jgi:hypothetical protein